MTTRGSKRIASRIAVSGSAVGRRAAREIAARKQRESLALLDTVRMEADDAARARPALLSLLSHDLRNPLSVILVSLRMLGRAIADDHAGRRHIDAITRAADEMNGILQDMSDVARIEEGRLTLTLSREDTAAMVEHAADSARRVAGAKDVSIAASTLDGAGAVVCDRARVQRLLAGLVASAVRITPRGGKVEVLSAPGDEGSVRISITDGGHGIPKDLGNRAFELPAGSSNSGGHARLPVTGLALYAARGVVEAHGGAIGIEPAPGGGSSFVITLPEG